MKIKVIIYKDAEDKYMAMIKGGWWVAYGSSKKSAIDNVKRRYLKEMGI